MPGFCNLFHHFPLFYWMQFCSSFKAEWALLILVFLHEFSFHWVSCPMRRSLLKPLHKSSCFLPWTSTPTPPRGETMSGSSLHTDLSMKILIYVPTSCYLTSVTSALVFLWQRFKRVGLQNVKIYQRIQKDKPQYTWKCAYIIYFMNMVDYVL